MDDPRWEKLKHLKGRLPSGRSESKRAETAAQRAAPGLDRIPGVRMLAKSDAAESSERRRLERLNRLQTANISNQKRERQELAALNARLAAVYRPKSRARPEDPNVEQGRILQRAADRRLSIVLEGPPIVPASGKEKFDLASRSAKYLEEGAGLRGVGGRRGQRRIVLGIDFGTAYTKACIANATTVVPVPWFPRRQSVDRYLLPGRLWVTTRQGHCHLGELDEGSVHFENLKLPLLATAWTADDEDRVIAFLALVMRYARHWTIHSESLGQLADALQWEVNIGFPTEAWSDKWRLDRFRALCRAAWSLSQQDTKFRAVDAGLARESAGAFDRSADLRLVRVVPEFAAQVASYSRSASRQEDLHLVVDVGAGTVDITCFNLSREADGSDLASVLTAKVARLGSHYLMANRMYDTPAARHWTDMGGVPSEVAAAQISGLIREEIAQRDMAVTRRMGGEVSKILKEVKTDRYPDSSRWNTGISTIICGGGGQLPAYRGLPTTVGYKLAAIDVPVPPRLAADHIDTASFGRLAVAYGLAFGYDDLGQFRPPRDVPNAPRKDPVQKEDVFVSMDQV